MYEYRPARQFTLLNIPPFRRTQAESEELVNILTAKFRAVGIAETGCSKRADSYAFTQTMKLIASANAPIDDRFRGLSVTQAIAAGIL